MIVIANKYNSKLFILQMSGNKTGVSNGINKNLNNKGMLVTIESKSAVNLPCGKRNEGTDRKRAMFARLHVKKCDICALADRKSLFKVEDNPIHDDPKKMKKHMSKAAVGGYVSEFTRHNPNLHKYLQSDSVAAPPSTC